MSFIGGTQYVAGVEFISLGHDHFLEGGIHSRNFDTFLFLGVSDPPVLGAPPLPDFTEHEGANIDGLPLFRVRTHRNGLSPLLELFPLPSLINGILLEESDRFIELITLNVGLVHSRVDVLAVLFIDIRYIVVVLYFKLRNHRSGNVNFTKIQV